MKDLVTEALMTKEDVTTLILIAKKKQKLSWEGIAKSIGMQRSSPIPPAWV